MKKNKCNKCGNCCKVIPLAKGLTKKYLKNISRSYDAEFIVKNWKRISKKTAKILLKNMGAKQLEYDFVFYQCKLLKLIKEDGFDKYICSAQEFKPDVCRYYPYYENNKSLQTSTKRKMKDVVLGPFCAFWNDII